MTHLHEKPVTLLTSGRILGEIVRCLRLDHVDSVGSAGSAARALRQKPVRRFFAGERVVEERRPEICRQIAEAAIELNWLPRIREGKGTNGSETWGSVLSSITNQWDNMVSRFPVRGVPEEFVDEALYPFLRFLVIDLTLRYAAAIHLMEWDIPTGETPDWAKVNGRCTHLRNLIKRCKPQPTREALASELDVQDTVLDRWLDNDIAPHDESILKLAEVLAPRLGETAAQVANGLRRHQALADLSALLAGAIGWARVEELVQALQKYTCWTLQLHVQSKSTRQLFMAFQEQTLLLGIAADSRHAVVRCLGRNEAHPIWRADIESVLYEKVFERLAYCLGLCRDGATVKEAMSLNNEAEDQITLVKGAMLMAQTNLTVLPTNLATGLPPETKVLRLTGDNAFKASNQRVQAETAMRLDNFKQAIIHFKRALELEPAHAKTRCRFGAALWQSGKMERAIEELWIASKLDPKWDIPFVEIGIVYINTKQPAQSLSHLLAAPSELPRTSHYWFYVGVSQYHLDEWELACDAFQKCIDMDNGNGRAWDYAADCHFKLQRPKDGLRYAKEAAHRGVGLALKEWHERGNKAI